MPRSRGNSLLAAGGKKTGGNPIRTLTYEIAESDEGCMVKGFLYRRGYSHRTQTKLKTGECSINCNGKHIRMIDRLCTGDVLTVVLREETWVEPNFALFAPIVYEDEDVIVYNKPPFMPVHPSAGHRDDTLANVFCAHMQAQDNEAAFHVLNRLDRDTSGLCVVAKHGLAAGILTERLEKEYTAIVCGQVVPSIGRIDAPLAQLDPYRVEQGVQEDGKRAVTNYRVERQTARYALVRVHLETGRTHQIRVHFAHIGYPLAGDSMYGGYMTDINRQALCCNKVNFMHPITNISINLCINIQDDMQVLMQSE